MKPIAKWLALIVCIGLVTLAFLFIAFDSIHHERERTYRHTHIVYGIEQTCCEPNCKEQD